MRENAELTKTPSALQLDFAFEFPDVVLQILRTKVETTAEADKDEPLENALKIIRAARLNTPDALAEAAEFYRSLTPEACDATAEQLSMIVDMYDDLFPQRAGTLMRQPPATEFTRIDRVRKTLSDAVETLKESDASGTEALAALLQKITTRRNPG